LSGATGFAFGPSTAAAAPAARVGSGRTGGGAGTHVGEKVGFVVWREIGRTRAGLAGQVGFDVAFRKFRAGGKQIRAERRVAGALPFTAWDVAGLTRPAMREEAFAVSISILLASRHRSPRGAPALGIGGTSWRRGPVSAGLELARDRLPPGRALRAGLRSGADVAGLVQVAAPRADGRAAASAPGRLADPRDASVIRFLDSVVGADVWWTLRTRCTFAIGRWGGTHPARRG